MFDCNNLVHPFQNDPGCSQSQRVMDDLLSATAKIDDRTLADLLNYFTELSPRIKYFQYRADSNFLKEDNWQNFFSQSLPFILATVTKMNADAVKEKFELYNQLFNKNPSARGLQLLIHFIYYSTIYKIDQLYKSVGDSDLPGAVVVEQTIKNKLKSIVVQFIKTSNTASNLFGIKPINFSLLDSIWGVNSQSLVIIDETITNITGRHQQLVALQNKVTDAFSSMPDAIRIISGAAGASLQQSLLPLKDDLKQKHTPHLALLFTFLNLFGKLQDDLNGYTKKHLDFFYQEVLQLKPKEAQPDEVHLVFELQKEVKQYALKKGLLAKADKDKKGAEIDFALDEDIVVNKTQVADLRTLFINNEKVAAYAYAEGVYMATKANTADGVGIDFTDDPKNYPTLGAKYSKYTAPGTASPKPYPPARIGFVLASPVLLLNEGERTIDITLRCRLDNNCKNVSETFTITGDPCCNSTIATVNDHENFPDFIDAGKLLGDVQTLLSGTYVYLNAQLIAQAQKKGLSELQANLIRDTYLKVDPDTNHDCPTSVCCSDLVAYLDEAIIKWDDWKIFLQGTDTNFTEVERNFLAVLFKPFKPLSVLLSGEKDWIDPSDDINKELTEASAVAATTHSLNMNIIGGDSTSFTISITALVTADKPAITFYNKDNLKEDLGTDQPLVKIELNDIIKLALTKEMYTEPGKPDELLCCLQTPDKLCRRYISLYHFFRQVVVTNTSITVNVCGLKNFIVQNDESVQDVNSPIYPFGTRPAIIDFDAVNRRNHDKKVEIRKEGEVPKTDANKKNLVGPNFYIGSVEIFAKKWKEVCIKLNWKDKPSNFNEYYKAYLKRFDYPDCSNPPNKADRYGLNECEFEVNLSLLDNGQWNKEKNTSKKVTQNKITTDYNRQLFSNETCNNDCDNNFFSYFFYIESTNFDVTSKFDNLTSVKKYDAATRKGFLKFTLENQDFLHKDYAFVLSRQMMALGRFPDVILESAVYEGSGNTVIVYKDIGQSIANLRELASKTSQTAQTTAAGADTLLTKYKTAIGGIPATKSISDGDRDTITPQVQDNQEATGQTSTGAKGVNETIESLEELLPLFDKNGHPITDLSVLIPNEPWTPIISNIALDYTAIAEKTDITLIHLYPYKNTYKQEQLTLNPPLFPSLCDEGTLFIGLSGLVPGSNVNMLFELAEATSDSESDNQPVFWNYLYNNEWFSLRKGYEVVDDATENLTASGIIKFALPENMTLDNTLMPAGLYWIKASVPRNSKAVCDTINTYTQAVKAVFVIDTANDTSRLSQPLEAGSVSKLKIADANVKQVTQPASSFDGREPEVTKHYYVRVSELLRHKGRAIQKFDYERLTLEAFPEVFKAKCINHSFKLDANIYSNDFPIAPGYVLIAVIPDLNKLQAGESFEPKLPTGVIKKIEAYLTSRTSPFVKIRAVNPRYEKINLCLSVILKRGYDKIFYKDQLKEDLREFLAPWAVGNFDKLRFGECINKSNVVQFLETREYVDYITKMEMQNDYYGSGPSENLAQICPHTPRSILLAGEIRVCIEEEDPDSFDAADCNNIKPVLDYCKPVKTIPV